MQEHVILKDIAEKLNMDRSRARRWLIDQGFMFVQIRDNVSKQVVNALTVEDAERAYEVRAQQGYAIGGNTSAVVVDDGIGVFYLVCLMPDIAPKRVKLGFANSLMSRLDAHRTTCPRLELIKHWPCRRTFEPAAIAVAVNGSSMLYGGEVYDVESVDEVVKRLDTFFAMVN